MENLNGKNISSLKEAYAAVYNNDLRAKLEEDKEVKEFSEFINLLIDEGYDLSEYTYDDLYEYYISEGKGKAALELIKTGVRSALKIPAGAPIRKTLAKGVVKGGAETITKVARDVTGGAANVLGSAYRGVRNFATKHPIKTAAAGGLAAYDISKGPQSLISRGAGLVGQGLSAAERAVYGGGQPQVATPKPPKPTPNQSKKDAWAQLNSVDLFDIIKGHLLDEGYADTEEAAIAIMSNMSEEWKQNILNEY